MSHFLRASLFYLLITVATAFAQQIQIVSSASFADEVAPGSLATVFIAGAVDVEIQAAPDSSGRLPTELGGVTIDIDGRSAEIWHASPTQINLGRSAGDGDSARSP